MKAIFAFLLVQTLLYVLSYGSGLELSKPLLMGKSPITDRKYDKEKKEWIEVDAFQYLVIVYLKNLSNSPVVVVTDGFSKESIKKPKSEVKLSLEEIRRSDDGSLIVPPEGELGLVKLRPEESAMMQFKWKADQSVDSLKVTYNLKEKYGGRFGYWTGRISSKPIQIKK